MAAVVFVRDLVLRALLFGAYMKGPRSFGNSHMYHTTIIPKDSVYTVIPDLRHQITGNHAGTVSRVSLCALILILVRFVPWALLGM